jgi:aspartate/tyrosine/aromatic aminotransferase
MFALLAAYHACSNANKVNLTIGAYRDAGGKPYVLQCVKEAEAALLADATVTKEYLPILGMPAFRKAAQHVLLTRELAATLETRLVTAQTLSGTGALRLALDTLRSSGAAAGAARLVLVSNPTWNNHKNLIQLAGLTPGEYRYLHAASNSLDLAGMLADLTAAPDNSIVILHACAHNPTGIDATDAQWREIARVMRSKRHLPLFDVAYQGYVTGDPVADGAAVRLFASFGTDMVVCQSFSKNLGLYSERIGAAHFLLGDTPDVAARLAAISSVLERHARGTYSNPPAHGAHIVARVVLDDRLRALWYSELKVMADRIELMRKRLREELEKLEAGGPTRTWHHITEQRGMFAYTGLAPKEVEHVVNDHAVYMTAAGRISIAGLTLDNVAYTARAFRDAINAAKSKL